MDVHRLIGPSSLLRLWRLLLHPIDCSLISINAAAGRRDSLLNGPCASRILVGVIQICRSPSLLSSSLKIKLMLLLLQLRLWPLDIHPWYPRLCWRELLYLAPELLPPKSRRRRLPSDGQSLIRIESPSRLILLLMLQRRVLLLNDEIRRVGEIEVIRIAAVIPMTRGIIPHLIIWLRLLKLARLLLPLLPRLPNHQHGLGRMFRPTP